MPRKSIQSHFKEQARRQLKRHAINPEHNSEIMTTTRNPLSNKLAREEVSARNNVSRLFSIIKNSELLEKEEVASFNKKE
jgi:hypothetical protein